MPRPVPSRGASRVEGPVAAGRVAAGGARGIRRRRGGRGARGPRGRRPGRPRPTSRSPACSRPPWRPSWCRSSSGPSGRWCGGGTGEGDRARVGQPPGALPRRGAPRRARLRGAGRPARARCSSSGTTTSTAGRRRSTPAPSSCPALRGRILDRDGGRPGRQPRQHRRDHRAPCPGRRPRPGRGGRARRGVRARARGRATSSAARGCAARTAPRRPRRAGPAPRRCRCRSPRTSTRPGRCRLVEQPERFPGLGVESRPVRVYPRPLGTSAAHVLGYLGQVRAEEVAARDRPRRRRPRRPGRARAAVRRRPARHPGPHRGLRRPPGPRDRRRLAHRAGARP